MDLLPEEEGGDYHLIQGAMIRLEDAGIYADKNDQADGAATEEAPDDSGSQAVEGDQDNQAAGAARKETK